MDELFCCSVTATGRPAEASFKISNLNHNQFSPVGASRQESVFLG